MKTEPFSPIQSLVPLSDSGHQFVCYGDCCSGIPNTENEKTFASVNTIISRLHPPPEFICFLGDEIKGLLVDEEGLRQQWRYWFENEMNWFYHQKIPLYHTTSNHNAYNTLSKRVFKDVLSHLPKNGPVGQEGLSYYIRQANLLMIFVNTMGSHEGCVETTWLDQTLRAHSDARYKLILGHHPAYPINGFVGDYQRNFDDRNRKIFWDILVRHRVLAYICSHIMAFDVQVHHGVLQILTAGAGTQPLMPEGIEYHHCVQMVLDRDVLRYQVLDTSDCIREWLRWPIELPHSREWLEIDDSDHIANTININSPQNTETHCVVWEFSGIQTGDRNGEPQTLLCGWMPGPLLAPLWIGCQGSENKLFVLLSAAAGRSPHSWVGPAVSPGEAFSIHVALHTGMGPGGLLWRWNDNTPWSSLKGASAWGCEHLVWPKRWGIGHDQCGRKGRPFQGNKLKMKMYMHQANLYSS